MAWKVMFWKLAAVFTLLTLSACAQPVATPAVAGPLASEAPASSVQAAPEVSPPAEAVAAGKKIYTSYCARCHGVDMVNVGATFDLRQFPLDERERFDRSVTQGLRAMPAWGGLLKPADLQSLWAYVSNARRMQ